jgi:transposase
MDTQLEHGQPEVPKAPTYDELVQLVRNQAELIQLQAEEIKLLKKKLFGSSSERNGSAGGRGRGSGSGPKGPNKKSRLRSLTEQYPDAEVENRHIAFDRTPLCQCCDRGMIDSGLTEITEQLHTVPVRHKIIRIIRKKYKCTGCFMGLLTAPMPLRIAPGSSLSNSFIIEAAIAKFYYLIPAERYAGMVSQSGLKDFPPQLILAAQHYMAEFLRPVYVLIRNLVQSSTLLHADETPHNMMEGSKIKGWYLWGFSAPGAYYFEIHPTRSGSVASDFLATSLCIFLMSDVYTGYARALREVNAMRTKVGLPHIIALYCNSHSRRRFVEAAINYPEEAQFYIDQYERIYTLDAELKTLIDHQSQIEKRAEMRPFFESMVNRGRQTRDAYSSKSSIVKAIDYLTNNYDGLTRFLENPALPIDNNAAERQLRSPVIGRKTWYGTHSDRGIETTEILFSIMQTCRLLKIDPRGYLKAVTKSMLSGGTAFTPSQYMASIPDKQVA